MRVLELEAAKVGGQVLPQWPDETVLEFRDTRDLLAYVSGGVAVDEFSTWLPSRDRIEEIASEFNSTKSYDLALDLARHGWREGADLFLDLAAHVTRTIKADVVTNSFRLDTTGVEPNVSAYLSGQPEDMLGWRKGQTRARHLNIVVDVNVRCSACGKRHHDAEPTTPSWVLLRGVAVLVLVRALQRARYTVTLTARTTSLFDTSGSVADYWDWPYYTGLRLDGRMERQHKLTTSVGLYRPGEMPDYSGLAFALLHNDFPRSILWRAEEVYHFEKFGPPQGWSQVDRYAKADPEMARQRCRNMAGALPLHQSHMPINQSYLPAPDILVPSIPMFEDAKGNKEVFGSVDTTLDWVLEALKGQGVKLT